MTPHGERRPITLREFAAGVRDDLFQLDRGLIGTFIDLAWRPGHTVRAFTVERDPRYAKPWRYLLFGVVAAISATWFVLDILGYRARLGLPAAAEDISFVVDNAALLTLITLPIVALVMRLCFVGLKLRYLDALIVLFYTQGQVNLYGLAALAGIAATNSQIADIPVTVGVLSYLIWAWAACAAGPWWRRLLAALLTLVGGQLINNVIVYAALQLAA